MRSQISQFSQKNEKIKKRINDDKTKIKNSTDERNLCPIFFMNFNTYHFFMKTKATSLQSEGTYAQILENIGSLKFLAIVFSTKL